MTLPHDYLTRPHVVFDAESFGLHGDAFASAAVLVRFTEVTSASDDRTWVTMRELAHFAATDHAAARPWRTDSLGCLWTGSIDDLCDARDHGVVDAGIVSWLKANIPEQVFAPERLTGDLSIFEMFDAFVEAAGEDVMLWAEVPVPVEANFLNELRANLFAPRRDFWKSLKAPLLRDVASLADPLRISDERVDMHRPAHDPLNDARASARRLCMALSKIVRLSEPDEAERRALIEHRFNGGVL